MNATNNANLTCVQVDDVAAANANVVWFKDVGANYNLDCGTNSIISPKVFLQGPLLSPDIAGLMNDDLRVNDLIPTTSPYSDALKCKNTVFNTTGNDAIVDWVWVELRDQANNTNIIEGQSALLQRDGDVVATDGSSSLIFNADSGNYYVVIKHRNHLGIMSTNTIVLSGVSLILNYTDANTPITYGTNAQTPFGMPTNTLAMWAGDVNNDGIIQYTGASPDTPNILSNVLNDAGNFLNLPTYIVNGYNTNDVDMNGASQYTGASPDSPFILQNALAHPGNFLNLSTYSITEQLPEN